MNTLTYDRVRRVYFLTHYIKSKDVTEYCEFSDSIHGINTLFKFLAQYRVNYVYCWDGAKLFADFDNWAARLGLPDYDKIAPPDEKGKRQRVNIECLSVRDGDQAYYTRRYWLKTFNLLTNDRHRRLHAVTLINAQNYFGNRDLRELFHTFQTDNLSEVLTKFNENIYKLTGLTLFDNLTEKPHFLTLGAISKAFYLRLKYPNEKPAARVMTYQNDFPAIKRVEKALRAGELLTGGIIYLKDTDTHCKLWKYDKVSLFPSTEKKLYALGIPVEISVDSFTSLNPRYEYIYIFKTLTLKRKNNMPALFPPQDGYEGVNLDYVEVKNIAMFAPLYKAYLKYYNVIDSEIQKIYRCRKIFDPAIILYVDILFREKSTAIDPAYYFIIKLILNNLHGKFAQNPITPVYERAQAPTGLVERRAVGLNDNWDTGHFDYIRGAYIYSMARAQMLNDLAEIAEDMEITATENGTASYRLVDHLYYSDTDSAILDHPITLDGMVGGDLGQFKFEGKIAKFHVYAPKIYSYYEEGNPEPVLKCAGAKANEIIEFWYSCHADSPAAHADLIEFLADNLELPITTLHRTDTGAEYRTEYRTLTAYGDYDEEGGEL